MGDEAKKGGILSGIKAIFGRYADIYTLGGWTIGALALFTFATAANPAMVFSGFLQNIIFDPTGAINPSHGLDLAWQGAQNGGQAIAQTAVGIKDSIEYGDIGYLGDALMQEFT